MTADDTPASEPPDEGLPCPKCRQPAGDVRRPSLGMLEFKCAACGHQWLLFDQLPQQESDR
jgi:hypothetical protein